MEPGKKACACDDESGQSRLHRLWGKADPSVPGGPHPAVLHMLDVAAVALELLADGLPPALARDLRELAPGVPITDAEIALAVACHDLGKLTPGFQAKVPEAAAQLARFGFAFPELSETDHAAATARDEITPALLGHLGSDSAAATLIAAAVAAHHGRVHDGSRGNRRLGSGHWVEVRELAVPTLAAALRADPARLRAQPSERWLMALAGLTVLSDWIGSDTDYFGYAAGGTANAPYVAGARERAGKALAALGWRGWKPAPAEPEFEVLFPGRRPNAMQQQVVAAVRELDRPGLLLIEAMTGSGKTEAALWAAEYQIVRFGLGGLYFALPTQATSNQMFGRVRNFLAGRYPVGQVNLHLLHALRDLQPDYQAIRTRSVAGGGGHVVADGWFHGKKRGLLSPFAVGTVDQAMLAALKSRFFQLRMLGLTRKVLVIDEVHAYDAFMSRILDRLLTWLSELGSSVILLSATLPRGRGRELLRAWQGDSGWAAQPFPRVTVGGSRPRAAAIAREEPERSVSLQFVPAPPDEVAARLTGALTGGGCAAWICNTVGAAQQAFQALRRQGWAREELVLFHARFPVEDRLAREQQVLAALGPEARRPGRLIVVATQVIEQSLDLDFDLIASEIAPIDLLVQRAGRLHRHAHRHPARAPSLRQPCIWIVLDTRMDGTPDLGASAFVYHPHVLLRTWWTLRDRRGWSLPEEADDLIESVYGDAPMPADAPPALCRLWEESASDLAHVLETARNRGAVQLVPPPSHPGDEESFLDRVHGELDEPDDAPDKHRDLLARTRDIEASVLLVCLAASGGDIVVSASDERRVQLDGAPPDRALTAALLRRSVSLQHALWVRRLRVQAPPAGWQRVAQLRSARCAVFAPDGTADIGGHTLRLDPELGLCLREPEEPT